MLMDVTVSIQQVDEFSNKVVQQRDQLLQMEVTSLSEEQSSQGWMAS